MSPESPRRFVHHGAFGNDRFGVLAERDKLRDAATREDHENTKLTEEIARLTEELHATICLPPNMAPSTGA
jgi:hypothetical protein